MAEELPVVCSLNAGDLEQRLGEIAALGNESLVGHEDRDGTQILHFRATAESRQRLNEIVAAEKQCCAFLDFAVTESDGELVLAISAPEAGQATAAALAAAFTGHVPS